MGLHLDVPDHTTLSRRGKTLKIKLKANCHIGPIDLIIDGTGIIVAGTLTGRISQAGQGRECLLQIQIDDRRPASISGSGRAKH